MSTAPETTEPAPDRIGVLIDAWYAERLARGYSPATMMMQRNRVRRAAGELDLLTVDAGTLAAWLSLHEWTPDTRRTFVAALRGFCDWLMAHHHRAGSPIDPEPERDHDELVLQQWATSLAAAGQGPGTVRGRLRQLRCFGRDRRLFEVSRDDVVVYLAERSRLEPETLKSDRSALRGFYRWAYRHGHLPEDPTDLLDPIRVPSTMDVTRVAPDEAVEHAMAAAGEYELGERDRLMVLLALHAGLRRAEIARVHRDDLQGETLTVLGKGRKKRRVPVGTELADAIRRADGWVFPSPQRPGQPLTADNVGRRLSKLLGPGWTGHTLRHRYATKAYKGTHDLLAVQRLLGHSSPVTTRRYVYTDDDALALAAAAGRGEAPPATQDAGAAAPRLTIVAGGAA